MMRDQFDNLSPLDHRYWDPEVAEYLSENGFIRYKLLAELALVKVLARRGICSKKVVRELVLDRAAGLFTPAAFYITIFVNWARS